MQEIKRKLTKLLLLFVPLTAKCGGAIFPPPPPPINNYQANLQ